MGSDPWHVGVRMRWWRQQRKLSGRAFADLVGRSPQWVSMAESGRRPCYRLDDLANVACALQVDLGVFLTEPVPGIPNDGQQAMLRLLKEAFEDPKRGLARLARLAGEADAGAGGGLVLLVEPGGKLKVVNRREAMKAAGLIGISLPVGWLYDDEDLKALAEGGMIGMSGVSALRSILSAYRQLDDEVGPGPLRIGVASHLKVVDGLRGAGKTEEVELELGRVTAELEQFSGWLAWGAGDKRNAVSFLRRALASARRVRDEGVAAYSLGWLSVAAADSGRPGDAVGYADAGVDVARRTGSRRLTAALCLRSARAHARAGNGAQVRARIDQARDALRDIAHRMSDPSFAYWVDETEVAAQSGEALVLLGASAEAIPLLREALARQRPDLVQQTASATGNLAVGLAHDGQLTEAAELGIATHRLFEQCPCVWTRSRLLELRGLVRDSRDPAAVEFRERLVGV